MRKYIDSELLKRSITENAQQSGEKLIVKIAEIICEMVDEMPAADVVERRQPNGRGV